MSNITSTREVIKGFLIDEFLSPEDANDLRIDTELYSTGILDSLGTLKLITFIEEEFGIMIEPRETTTEYLQTIAHIAKLVELKC